MILKMLRPIDWKQLLTHMELYWEVLLMALLNFRFVYPSERHLVPRWIMEELLERLRDQSDVKGPARKSAAAAFSRPRDYTHRCESVGFFGSRRNLEEHYGDRQWKLRVAAIGDLHVQENDIAPIANVQRDLPRADVLVLCGDLTNFGKDERSQDSGRGHQGLRHPSHRGAGEPRLMRPAREVTETCTRPG